MHRERDRFLVVRLRNGQVKTIYAVQRGHKRVAAVLHGPYRSLRKAMYGPDGRSWHAPLYVISSKKGTCPV